MTIARGIRAWVIGQMEGPASACAVAVFAALFALDGADKGAISAMALPLRQSLGIGQMELGLLPMIHGLHAHATSERRPQAIALDPAVFGLDGTGGGRL